MTGSVSSGSKDAKYVAGIDLGGTNVKTALVDMNGAIVSRDSRPTQAEGGPEAVMDTMAKGVQSVLDKAGAAMGDVLAVGIGSPGPLNWQSGIVYHTPNLPGWKNVPLADRMAERLKRPVYVDNDANVACYGEFWSGAGAGSDTMVLMTLGTGVGGGIVVFKRLLRGIDGTAAEIGHMNVERDGRVCGCGAKGCLEAYASVSGLVRTAVAGIQDGRETVLLEMANGDPETLTGKMISDAGREGDAFARWVLQETATYLGIASGSLINLLNPEKILFSGGMIAAGEVLFETIRETARLHSFDVPYNRVHIGAAALGEDAGVIGSAGCALERHRAHEA